MPPRLTARNSTGPARAYLEYALSSSSIVVLVEQLSDLRSRPDGATALTPSQRIAAMPNRLSLDQYSGCPQIRQTGRDALDGDGTARAVDTFDQQLTPTQGVPLNKGRHRFSLSCSSSAQLRGRSTKGTPHAAP